MIRSPIGRILDRWRSSRRATAAGAGLDLHDLLGRRPINLDTPQLQRFLAGKRVLVTGAGGSIGSEICRQTLRFCPRHLVLLDQAENSLFEIDRELRQRWVGAEMSAVVADIGDAVRISRVMHACQPQVIFHCAAHKHVPMMELNPGEAIKNNVLGTKTVADAALAAGAASFVMVSTDKAVNPSSVMGAAKRCAELYIQSLNEIEPGESRGDASLCPGVSTRFVAVRFGNVLGSSGSVVPIFRRQIEAGGPVTVTHPDMTRYFMTIPEASQLVMQAGAFAGGGEIFVLDMGRPIRILDLAMEMIRRYGLRPHEDIAIEFSGVRPGEKLYEELAGASERTRPTSHAKIRVWQLPRSTRQEAERMIDSLRGVTDADAATIVQTLRKWVPEYQGGDVKASCDGPALRLAERQAA